MCSCTKSIWFGKKKKSEVKSKRKRRKKKENGEHTSECGIDVNVRVQRVYERNRSTAASTKTIQFSVSVWMNVFSRLCVFVSVMCLCEVDVSVYRVRQLVSVYRYEAMFVSIHTKIAYGDCYRCVLSSLSIFVTNFQQIYRVSYEIKASISCWRTPTILFKIWK